MAKEKFDRSKSHVNFDGDDIPQDLSDPDPSPPPQDPPPFSRIQAEFQPLASSGDAAEEGDELVSPDTPPPDPQAAKAKYFNYEMKDVKVVGVSHSHSNDNEYKYVNVRRFLMIGIGVIIILGVGLALFGLPGGGNIFGAKSNSDDGGASAAEATAEPTKKSPPPLLTIDVWEHASVGCIDDLTAEMPIVCINNDGDEAIEWGDLNLSPGAEWCRPAALRLPNGSQADTSQIMPGDIFDHTLTIFNQGPNTSANYPDVAELFKDTAEGDPGPSVVGLDFVERDDGDLDLYLVNAPGGDNALNMDVVALMFLMREVPPYCEPVSLPPPDVTEEPTEEPQDSSQPVSTEESTEEPGSGELPPSTCGDLICDPFTENTDLCSSDCQCIDDGICAPGEGESCQDCGSSAGTCGATCADSSQCAAGLSCAGGVCWDAETCGSDPGGSSGGGGGGEECTIVRREENLDRPNCPLYHDSCGGVTEICN